MPSVLFGEQKNIVVGVSPDFPPFEFIKNNELSGVDIDIINEIGKRINRDLVFRSAPFPSLMNMLTTKEIDLVISAVSVTQERINRGKIVFSIPYFHSSFVILSKKAIGNLSDISNKAIAAQIGSVAEDFLTRLQKNGQPIKIKSLSNNNVAIEMLKNNIVDFVCLEGAQAKQYMALNKNLMSLVVGNGGGYTIALPTGSGLLNPINDAINDMYQSGMMDDFYKKWFESDANSNSVLSDNFEIFKYIGGGVVITLVYSVLAVFFGFLVGILMSILICGPSKLLCLIGNIYISIIRGTPLLLQLSIVYFVLPIFFGPISVWFAAILSLSVNSGAYIASLISGALKNFNHGQIDAANSLNLSTLQKYRDIIGPQIFVNILPSLINEMLDLIKESAIISIVGGQDIMYRANIIGATQYSFLFPMVVAGFYYYLISLGMHCVIFLIKKKNKKCK